MSWQEILAQQSVLGSSCCLGSSDLEGVGERRVPFG